MLACGTAQYTYDGSGKIHRIGHRQIAVFSAGRKIFSSTLSASYSIGTRHWIREYSKSLCRNTGALQADKSFPTAARHQRVSASLISWCSMTVLRLCPIQASAVPKRKPPSSLQQESDGRRIAKIFAYMICSIPIAINKMPATTAAL